MNRQQALEWLVENVTKWPVSDSGTASPLDWFWHQCNGIVTLDSVAPFDSITQQDWLDA